MNKNTIGKFDVDSGELVISDPCYPLRLGYQGQIENVARGSWEAAVYTLGEGFGCVACIEATHTSVNQEDALILHGSGFKIGVDSAQAGIFDLQYYGKDEVIPAGVSAGADVGLAFVPRRPVGPHLQA